MRKILLLICIVFAVLCYAFPCIILPFGEYKYETKGIANEKITISYQFAFNGKVKLSANESSAVCYYKLKGTNIIISDDNTFDKNDEKIAINSFYELDTSLTGKDAKNQTAFWSTVGVCVAAVLLVVTIPGKKKS